ncbi:MAG TPA: carbohydrate-binding protein CenC, partial [Vicinamibacteria bacterium]
MPNPTPTPTPVAQATPSPTPSPDCAPGGDCPGNTTPVVRVVLRLYRLFDNLGLWVLPTPDPT